MRWALTTDQRLSDPSRALFVQGFTAMLPLWAGAIPVGIAYGVAAREAGLGVVETQLMSLLVFSAAAQVSAVSLIDAGAPGVILIGTTLALNAQLFLLGLAAGRSTRPSWPMRLVTAYFLTDGAFGVAAAGGGLAISRLLGAGVGMFTGWNLGTALGIGAGQALPNIQELGIDFVVPLTFLAVLVPLVRSRPAVLTVAVAAATTVVLNQAALGGMTILGAGIAGSIAGMWSANR